MLDATNREALWKFVKNTRADAVKNGNDDSRVLFETDKLSAIAQQLCNEARIDET